MVPVHECSYWSMETEDWLVDADGGTLLLAPPDDSALLRIDTVGAWAPNWDGLQIDAQRRAPKGAVIEPVTCGAFSGLKYESCDAEGDYWRQWLLTLGELFLIVSYSADAQFKERDRRFVDRLLSTLADRRA